MGHARARKVPAQLVEDEDYQLRYERVAGIDVAKAKADVCTRLPPAREGALASSCRRLWLVSSHEGQSTGPARSRNRGSRGNTHERCCHGLIASSASHRAIVAADASVTPRSITSAM